MTRSPMSQSLDPRRGAGRPPGKREYYHLFFAQAIALLSTGLATIALAFLAYRLAGAEAGAVLGTALAIKMLTNMLVAPLAAAFAARLPRRSLLIGLDLVRGGMVLALPFVTQVWEVFVLIFVFQAASAAFTPTYQATIPDLLPDQKDYARAISRSRLVYETEGVLSPMLAAALLTVMSFPGIFLIAFAGFLVSACLIVFIALPIPTASGHEPVVERTTRGMRMFLVTPSLQGLLALELAAAAATAMVVVNTVVVVQSVLGMSAGATAFALGVFGAGSVLAALALPRLLENVSERTTMLTGAALVTVGLLVGIMVPAYSLLLLLWFGLGLGCGLIQTPAVALVRRSSNRENRPYLYAAHFALAHACLILAYPMAGWLGAETNMSMAFAIFGMAAVLAALAARRLWPTHDRDVARESGRVTEPAPRERPDEVPGIIR
jgi:MFS family permease